MIKKAITILTVVALIFTLTAPTTFAATKKYIPNTNVKVDSRIADAFVDLGFKVTYNKNLGYAGVFSVAKHKIIMKSKTKLNILHEVGHFVSELTRNAGTSKAFKKIYKAEKKKYRGTLKKYITGSSEEYFAQSFAEFSNKPATLKKERPKTYKFIKKTVDSINDAAVNEMYEAYSWAW